MDTTDEIDAMTEQHGGMSEIMTDNTDITESNRNGTDSG